MVNLPVELFTDGSSIRNPGASGLGWVIHYYEQKDDNSMPEEHFIEGNEGFRLSTNNRMELMAFIYGAEKFLKQVEDGLFEHVRQLNVFSDSEYLVKCINQNWIAKWTSSNWMTSGYKGAKPKPVKNKDLWLKINDIQKTFKSSGINLTMTHVMGHNGNELNEKADQLAVQASSQLAVKIDEEYEKSTSNKGGFSG